MSKDNLEMHQPNELRVNSAKETMEGDFMWSIFENEIDPIKFSILRKNMLGLNSIFFTLFSLFDNFYLPFFISQNIAVKHFSDPKSMSQPSRPSKCDSLHVIRVENFPWTATKRMIVYFFADIKILNGENGIHFIVDPVRIRTDAFIQLASSKDYRLAMNRKQLQMFNFTVNS